MGEIEPVAILGAGRMGAAMAGRLRRADVDVVVFNRSRRRAEAVAAETGATVVGTAREAAGSAGVVLSVLADDTAVREVWAEAAPGLRPGAVAVEMSTIDPATLAEVRPEVERSGATLLDAPVSGSVPAVEDGALTIMVGGEPAALERVRAVLDVLASRVLHLGLSGAGATMKLAVNSVIHATNVALSEALVLGERAGVDRAAAYEVFASSAAASPYVLAKRSAFEDPDTAPVAFTLDLVAKDLDLILSLADRVGVTVDQGRTNRAIVGRAVAAGLGQHDLSAVATHLRRRGQPNVTRG